MIRGLGMEMGRITVLENDQITIWCYPELGIIHHEMHRVIYGQPFRDALSSGLEAMIRYRATKWLSDDRANSALSPADEDWATTTWFPKVHAAGWTHWAMVQPHMLIGKMNAERFVKGYSERGICARLFTDPREAFEWLKNPDAG